MKKILFVCFGYDFENPENANAISVNNIINYIYTEYAITIITNTDNTKIQFINKKDVSLIKIPIGKKARSGKYDFINWNKKVFDFLLNNTLIDEFKTILTVSFPIHCHFIGLEVKRYFPMINWIAYQLDPYAYCYLLRFQKMAFPIRYFQEKKIIKNADQVFLTHELYKDYNQNKFSYYKDKFVNLGIPVLKFPLELTKINSKQKCKLFYTGSFYKNVRNPEYMLKVLNEIVNLLDCELHIYGPTIKEVKEYFEVNNKIIIHGRLPKKELENALIEASVLVSVGNNINNQLPSKVLEYIATGKPIINFYSIDDDTSNYYLKKHPNALLIKEDEVKFDESVNLVKNFIVNQKHTYVSLEELKEIYKPYSIENIIYKVKNYI